MLELLILCTIIIVSRFFYGTIFTITLFLGIIIGFYFTSVHELIVFACIILTIPVILKIKRYKKDKNAYSPKSTN